MKPEQYVTLPLQYNYQVAQARKMFVFWATLPLLWSETFWKTWSEVYRP